jgi:hypothetical protein
MNFLWPGSSPWTTGSSPWTPLEALLLAIMVPLAQGLPVAPVPEQRRITAMGNDMVDDGGGRGRTLLLAHAAERVIRQEPAACLVPLPIIATLTSAASERIRGPIPGTLAFLRRESVT